MPENYRNLTYEERCLIEALVKSGLSKGEIAQQLGSNRATIYRDQAQQRKAGLPSQAGAEEGGGTPPGCLGCSVAIYT